MADTTGTRYTQIKTLDRKGDGTQAQSFGGGSTTAGDVAVYDAGGNVIDGGVLLSTIVTAIASIGNRVVEIPAGTLNSTNVTFTLSHTPLPNFLDLYLNGVEQVLGVDFTLSGATITMTVAPKARDTGYWIAEYEY